MDSEMHPFLLATAAGAAFAIFVYGVVRTLSYSRTAYDYPVLINDINCLYLVSFVLAVAAMLAAPPAELSVNYVIVATIAALAPTAYAIARNVKSTSLGFGLWISVIQLILLSIIVIVMFPLMGGRRDWRARKGA
jgi:hypothetical protein